MKHRETSQPNQGEQGQGKGRQHGLQEKQEKKGQRIQESWAVKANPDHRWYYKRGMGTEDVVCFKCFDSFDSTLLSSSSLSLDSLDSSSSPSWSSSSFAESTSFAEGASITETSTAANLRRDGDSAVVVEGTDGGANKGTKEVSAKGAGEQRGSGGKSENENETETENKNKDGNKNENGNGNGNQNEHGSRSGGAEKVKDKEEGNEKSVEVKIARRVPHCAVEDPSVEADAPWRESVEVRCLVFY
jgi:hypothetical protein